MTEHNVAKFVQEQLDYILAKLTSAAEQKSRDTMKAPISRLREFIISVREAFSLGDGFLDTDFKNVENALLNLDRYCAGDGISDSDAMIFADYVELKLKYVTVTYDCFKKIAE